MSAATSYDAVPYVQRSYVQATPDRLATIARLHGLHAPPADACRVLDLGCASGGHSIPLAAAYPRCEFVGVDAARAQIDAGTRDIERLGLPNIRLVHQSFLDLDASWGAFDYIVAHGVYSWVPPDVRDGMLARIALLLAPQGVAYVSYNTLPGWSVLRTVRDALLLRTRGIADVRRRAATARNLLDFLAAADGDYSVFPERPVRMAARFFKEKVDALGADADAYLVHELLEPINEPVYFEQFVEHAERHGLSFVAEAELGDTLLDAFPPAVAQALDAATDDPVERGQYVDFIRDQTFRQTLLCHDAAPVRADVQPQAVFEMLASSRATVYRDDEAGVTYLHDAAHDATFAAEHAPTRAAVAFLAARWPRAVAFGDLVAAIGEAGVDIDGEDLYLLARNLLRAYGTRKELVSLHTTVPRVAATVAERPVASAVARLQAARGATVTTLLHEQVGLGPAERGVLLQLDGDTDRAALLRMVGDDTTLDALLDTLRRAALLVDA